MKEGTTTGVIHINNMEARVFKLMLTFIYNDSMPNINEEEDMEEDEEKDDDVDDIEVMWQHLLVAADRYDLQRLRLMCENKLYGYINATKVASILELAEQHHCRGLKEACLDFLNFPLN
ncbi:hypothetical protein BDA96_01G256300 [Sorghum bicolor]|uniref:BTB domain-containing protein n=1 Tax=Sorghum bicolor TaxID=4558 RepID=A0A921UZU9_SORBI|nr:hypothetical protein BDA96_01G256300 [Sorghum bicolor]